MAWHIALESASGCKIVDGLTGLLLNLTAARTIGRSLMREIRRSELVAWLKIIPTRMSCLMGAAPDLPRDVLLELLKREWATYANDGRLVRTDKGQSVSERE